MFNEGNKDDMRACSQCGCRGGMIHAGMGMWAHMPKEVKVAKLEKKEQMLRAELDFIGKMKKMAMNMPGEKK